MRNHDDGLIHFPVKIAKQPQNLLTVFRIQRTSRLITHQYHAASPDIEPRVKTLNRLARMVLLVALALINLRLGLLQLGTVFGLIQE